MSDELKIPFETKDQQFKASDPANSSWLSANAGSGKTHVLTQRVIRLMLAGNAPDRIMCLTFTKAAAANMKNRVFETLATWTMMADDALDKEIEKSTDEKPTPQSKAKARQLFAKALDTPGGLKIQTIHGFCESLLHQFPLEANVPGHFETVQEVEQASMLKRATSEVLGGGDERIIRHYEALVPQASDHAITQGIAAIIAKREDFENWYNKAGPTTPMDELYAFFEVSAQDTEESIMQSVLDKITTSNETLKAIAELAATGTESTDQPLSKRLNIFLNETCVRSRYFNLLDAVLTASEEDPKKRSKRKSPITKGLQKKLPDALDVLHELADYLLANRGRRFIPVLLNNSYHLFEIGYAILERYQAMKRNRGIIDFNDQIERCANLLNRSDIRDWIRYRLDMGVDHVLVDEAQDTSPAQWQIINAITEDFHSGETAAQKNRTIFVVGDEKQSIFSFQGAEPQEFDQQRRRLEKTVNASPQHFHPGSLKLSFRSTEDVLHAVDKVFGVEENRHGLTQSNDAPVHDSVRETHAGEVQVWPIFDKTKPPKIESWLDPVDHVGNEDPSILLAERISDEIQSVVGTQLPGMDRPLRYKDILVLVRSRDQFITALTRIMKEKGLAIAGADRLKLTEHIAVEDMLAIGRAAILPQDDLSFASSLKGLFFNLGDNDLFEFAHPRAKHVGLWEEIQIAAANPEDQRHENALKIAGRFERIQSIARTNSSFEFFARLLGELGGRKQILSRLGSEAEDVIDAFLDEALSYTRDQNGSLEGFLSQITSANPEIKREVELSRDEVRILTVHSSKGLEAPFIFLVDPCGPAWNKSHSPKLMPLPSDNAYKPMVWIPSSKEHSLETTAAEALIETAANAEYRRLLYVGMTRAADRLVVCGYRRKSSDKYPHWHKMVHEALASSATEMKNEAGETIGIRWVEKEKPARALKSAPDDIALQENNTLPDWLFGKVKSDPPLPRPLTPSGASALIDRDLKPTPNYPIQASAKDSQFALRKGNITHKLLEILPEVETGAREDIARKYLTDTCSDWGQSEQEAIFKSIFKILNHSDYSQLFSNPAKAEVSLAGWVDTRLGNLQISGQIDRLVIAGETVTILDYKTNYTVPKAAENTPIEYQIQLALYRNLIRPLYPEHRIVSALMWTQTPELMILPDELLDKAIDMFKKW